MKYPDDDLLQRTPVLVKSNWQSAVRPYGIALTVTALALALHWMLTSLLGPGTFAYITLYPTIVLVASWLGLGPALLSLCAGAVAAFYVFLNTAAVNNAQAQQQVLTGLVLYLVLGAGTALLGNISFRARRLAMLQTQQLRETEKRYRSTFENAAVGIAHFGLNARFLRVNERLCQMLGYTRGELLATDWLTLSHPDEIQHNLYLRECHLRGDFAAYTLEKRYFRKDGSTLWVNLTANVQRDEQGTPQYFIAFIEDISPRKQAEEQLRESQEIIQRQFAEIETIYQTAPVGLTFVDRELRYVRVNERCAEIDGFSVSDHLGRTLHEVLPASLVERLEPLYRQVLTTGEPVLNLEITGETNAQPGVQRAWILNYYPLRNATGDILGVNAVIQEITERKRQEEALQERHHQLDLLARTSQLLLLGQHTEAELLTTLFGEVAQTIGAEMYFNYQPTDQQAMRLSTWGGLTDDERLLFETMRYGELLCGRVAVQQQPIIVEDIAHTTIEGSEAVRAAGYGAYAGFPLLAGERLLGTIAFVTRTKTHFRAGEVQMIQTVCDQVAIMLERMRLMRELRESEERQRLALDGADLGSWDIDLRTGEAVWSRRHTFLQGYEPDSTPPTLVSWQERVHPDDAERVMADIDHARRTREPLVTEHRLLRADTGEMRWLSLYGRFAYDEAGAPVRFSGVSRDISERKQAEESLQRSEHRYRTLVDATSAVTWTCPPSGLHVELQPSWMAFTGQSAEEMLGAGWTKAVHPDDVATSAARWNDAVVEGKPFSNEHRILRHDQEWRWMSVYAAPVRDASGQIVEWVGMNLDITERKEIELEREQILRREQQARQLAEESNRAKDDWLAVVTHELRSPLHAILGHARLLNMRHAQLAPEFAEFTDLVRRNGERQNELINDLLDTARMATGKLQLEPGPVSLVDVIANALESVQSVAQARTISLVPEIDWSLDAIRGDAARLQQVVWNLLTNAVKFTPSGGKVSIALRGKPGQVELIVRDTGQGIAPEFLPHVFDRFSQQDTSRSRRHGGLGLGLALVKQIVELHGGTITAESAGTGQGATFTVTLPVTAPIIAERKERRAIIASETPRQGNSQARAITALVGVSLLVIDDEMDTRNLLQALLSEQGATVLTVESAAAAWPLLTAPVRPRLVVCDIEMPEEDGYSLLKRLRSWEKEQSQPTLPALALTAHNATSDRLQALQAGFQMHVAKPAEPLELLLMLQSLLERERPKDLKTDPSKKDERI
ncbi:MAG TPA: PAS domain S-box protein [Blastocatellia bacterium]|nr:PAS domain S-box protein [Blastocatellia bacterium]